MNPRIYVGAIVAAFAVVLAVLTTSGSSVISDVSEEGIFSPSSSDQPQVLPVQIELEDISIEEVTEKAATLNLAFKVTNPNYKSVIMQLIKYEIYEGDLRISAGQIGERQDGMVVGSNYFTILSERPTILSEKVTIRNSGNTPELWTTLSEGTPQWTIKGEAFFNLSSMTSGGENELTFEFTK